MLIRSGLGRYVLRPKIFLHQLSRPTRRFQHDKRGMNHSNLLPFPGQKSAQSLLKGFIAANCVVFAAWQFATIRVEGESASLTRTKNDLTRELKDKFLLRQDDIAHGNYWGAILANFSHINIIHFGFNMTAFWSLGNGIIAYLPQMTAPRFFTLCMGSALGATIGSYTHKKSRGIHNPSLGASGIIAGITGAIALRAPSSTMSFIFLPGVYIPTWAMAGAAAAYTAYAVWAYNPSNPSIFDHAGHLGGAVFGILYYLLALRRARPPKMW